MLWRDPSGIDILLAPPRVEMAEMVTVRDLEKTLSLLRRVYEVVIVDTPAVINDVNLSFLDASDTILEVVTYDSTTIHSTMVMADAFRMIGYPPTKVRYLVNRSDSTGGFDPEVLNQALGRMPEHSVGSGGALVVQANNEGIPFVLADPSAQISQDVIRTATELIGRRRARGPRRGECGAVSDPRPIGVFDSGVGGLTVLREILRRSPHESTIYLGDNARAPYGVRTDDEVRRFSVQALDELRAGRQGARGRVQHVDGRRPARSCAPGTTCRSWVWSGPVPRRRGPRHPQPASGRDRHAGDRPVPRLLQRDQGREPCGRGLRARHPALRAHGRGGHAVRRGARGRRRGGAGAASRGARRGRGVRLPAAAVGQDRHPAAGLHALPVAARS